ncbi:hypothetical protein Z948_3544 [Sulfitobacter donghicola DSW-25 = KCTC 12864 = JCM 14565]|nr:hypothetical protein Z948_3544 [Sulfitobacter donghicola DSW-25 = KCTC 12864 = JCM 14565]
MGSHMKAPSRLHCMHQPAAKRAPSFARLRQILSRTALAAPDICLI